jgi:hypothetical protein
MESTTVPPPEELLQRINDCEIELKSLRRLLRVSQSLRDANEARQRRTSPARQLEVRRGK